MGFGGGGGGDTTTTIQKSDPPEWWRDILLGTGGTDAVPYRAPGTNGPDDPGQEAVAAVPGQQGLLDQMRGIYDKATAQGPFPLSYVIPPNEFQTAWASQAINEGQFLANQAAGFQGMGSGLMENLVQGILAGPNGGLPTTQDVLAGAGGAWAAPNYTGPVSTDFSVGGYSGPSAAYAPTAYSGPTASYTAGAYGGPSSEGFQADAYSGPSATGTYAPGTYTPGQFSSWYLNPTDNPLFSAAMESTIEPMRRNWAESILPGLQSQAQLAGAYGGSASGRAVGRATEALAQAEAEQRDKMLLQAYQFERGGLANQENLLEQLRSGRFTANAANLANLAGQDAANASQRWATEQGLRENALVAAQNAATQRYTSTEALRAAADTAAAQQALQAWTTGQTLTAQGQQAEAGLASQRYGLQQQLGAQLAQAAEQGATSRFNTTTQAGQQAWDTLTKAAFGLQGQREGNYNQLQQLEGRLAPVLLGQAGQALDQSTQLTGQVGSAVNSWNQNALQQQMQQWYAPQQYAEQQANWLSNVMGGLAQGYGVRSTDTTAPGQSPLSSGIMGALGGAGLGYGASELGLGTALGISNPWLIGGGAALGLLSGLFD